MQSEIAYEVQNFLYHKARLLDERRFNERLAMFAEDVRYWMPVRGNRYPKSSKAVMVMEPDTYIEDDVAQSHEMAFFDETKKTLSGRKWKRVWPGRRLPSKTRHLISNVLSNRRSRLGKFCVYSNFIVYRNRAEVELNTIRARDRTPCVAQTTG